MWSFYFGTSSSLFFDIYTIPINALHLILKIFFPEYIYIYVIFINDSLPICDRVNVEVELKLSIYFRPTHKFCKFIMLSLSKVIDISLRSIQDLRPLSAVYSFQFLYMYMLQNIILEYLLPFVTWCCDTSFYNILSFRGQGLTPRLRLCAFIRNAEFLYP